MKTKISLLLLALVFLATGCEHYNSPEETPYFSVSSSKKIAFSLGNLQYNASTNKWRFAENQYDYIGEDNIHISDTYAGWIDLFGWGTGNSPTLDTFDLRDYFYGSLWETNSINGDEPNTWRTLTDLEWRYLLDKRPNAEMLHGVAQVNGSNGLILLPDNWVAPRGVSFTYGFHTDESKEAYAEFQTFTKKEWNKLEKSGAIFLPAAGKRSPDFGDGAQIHYVQIYGMYWTSDLNGTTTASMCFSSAIAFYDVKRALYEGLSVRLVKDL
jgi:hypothetical protein